MKTQDANLIIKPFGNIFMLFSPMMIWPLVSIFCMWLERGGLIARQPDYNGMPINVATVLFFFIATHSLIYYNMYKNWSKQLLAS
ncbi:hypothetical protein [Mucilaginibacter antarcticus]|uniref:hypothetical protein n=1 Tax=Mucilaginibacter antarcticus TaxID=1855725 RepID=UPI00363105CB